jgi:hypothetical protein
MVAVWGVVVDDYYELSVAATIGITAPSNVTVVTINGSKYYELSYEKHDKIWVNLNMVKVNTLFLILYQEFIAKANIPWYMSYEQIGLISETAQLHADANLGTDSAIIELMISATARQHKDKKEFIRHQANVSPDTVPAYIPLTSVAFQVTNTFAKLAGGYFNEGMTSALVYPTTTNEPIETILRELGNKCLTQD